MRSNGPEGNPVDHKALRRRTSRVFAAIKISLEIDALADKRHAVLIPLKGSGVELWSSSLAALYKIRAPRACSSS